MKGFDTKAVVEIVRNSLAISRREAALYTKAVLYAIKKRLEQGEELNIKGLASFYYQKRAAKIITKSFKISKPDKGWEVVIKPRTIPERYVLKCKISTALRCKIRDVKPKIDPVTGKPNWVAHKSYPISQALKMRQPTEGLSK